LDKKEVFKKFLETNEVLIVDKNPSSRNRLFKTLIDMGAQNSMIHTAGNLTEAEWFINTKKIGVVLSDYLVGGGSGFDLFKMIREKYPENKELCLILVTSNISQTAVAKAAEEDVDSFIIKPYTIQSIQDNLISTISQKAKPSEYILKVNDAKDLIKAEKYDEAITLLKTGMALHQKPALALFYIGQAEYLKNHVEEATFSYNNGLNFNSIHYKCLVGLYEIFFRDHKFDEAYQVVRKIAKFFPANPDRLTQIVRLAIRTGNFQDMQSYYEIYTSLDERQTILTNYLGAGMFIAGKYNLMNNDPETAIQYFDNIAVSCSEFTKFLRAVVDVLIEHKMPLDAEKYLPRFPSSTKEHEDFLVSQYLVTSHQSKDNGLIIKLGLELYNKKIRDFSCMKTLMEAMIKNGYNEDKLAPYKAEMKILFPEKLSLA
jgi:DNA-binding response OmpR family regulator